MEFHAEKQMINRNVQNPNNNETRRKFVNVAVAQKFKRFQRKSIDMSSTLPSPRHKTIEIQQNVVDVAATLPKNNRNSLKVRGVRSDKPEDSDNVAKMRRRCRRRAENKSKLI